MSQISVIVPVYKVEQYLDRCVESILAQTFSDFELILVDDGSPDNCPKMCDEWAKKDNRIVVIHKQNGGLSDARNAGIDWVFDNSLSQWITFVDSDDWVPVNALKFLVDSAIADNSEVSIGRLTNHNAEQQLNNTIISGTFDELYNNDNYAINLVSACGKLYKKQLWENIRFPVGRLHEDRFTTYKVLFLCSKISVIDSPVYYYFQSDESITRSTWNPRRLDDFDAIKEQLRFFKKHNLPDAYMRVIKDSIFVLETMLNDLDKIRPKYFKYRIRLRFKLKRMLLKYRKKLGMSFKKNTQLYECAFPLTIKLYWDAKGIISRFRK